MKWIRGLIDAMHLRLAEHFQWCAEKHMEWRKKK